MVALSDTILVIDVGNTSTSLGLYRNGEITRRERVDGQAPGHRVSFEKLGRLTNGESVDGAVLATVVPKVAEGWIALIDHVCRVETLRVSHTLNLGVAIDYPNPGAIGEDRLANAAGAAKLFGTPACVADFGTALTFDVLDAEKGYIGGVIAPGLPLMFDYLAEKTALLPHIAPAEIEERMVGKNTEEAIQIGARWGYLGMVRELFTKIKQELNAPELRLCATGGYAPWILRGEDVDIVPELTLLGLAQIYHLNKENK